MTRWTDKGLVLYESDYLYIEFEDGSRQTVYTVPNGAGKVVVTSFGGEQLTKPAVPLPPQ